MKDRVYGLLVDSLYILQTKWHCNPFIHANRTKTLQSIFENKDLIITRMAIHEAKYNTSSHRIHQHVYYWHGILILGMTFFRLLKSIQIHNLPFLLVTWIIFES